MDYHADFEWNEHRFSGGVIILDLINTVVHRAKPDLKVDRLDGPVRIAGFADAVSRFRHGELFGRHVIAPADQSGTRKLLKLREVADFVFRSKACSHDIDMPSAKSLHKLFSAAADASKTERAPDTSVALGLACSMSAMRLLGRGFTGTIRACPNCDWLFLDKSKNGSRRWCDMAVCGNRAKVARHYRRQNSDTEL